jgi:hypothetical protein
MLFPRPDSMADSAHDIAFRNLGDKAVARTAKPGRRGVRSTLIARRSHGPI